MGIIFSKAKCFELKHRFPTIRKQESQSMEEYLWDIKVITNSLTATANPLSNQELVQYSLFGLDGDFEGLITVVAYYGGNLTFDDLRAKLILYLQHVLFFHHTHFTSVMH